MDIKHCDLADAIHDRDKQIRNLRKDIESHKESCADINFKRISFMDENVSLMQDLQDIIKLFSEQKRNGECNRIQYDNITERVKSRAYDFSNHITGNFLVAKKYNKTLVRIPNSSFLSKKDILRISNQMNSL